MAVTGWELAGLAPVEAVEQVREEWASPEVEGQEQAESAWDRPVLRAPRAQVQLRGTPADRPIG
jgi:hypothetical protein